MIFGVDYYPEHWPEERWPLDARMMAETGINTVRLAEFSWVKLEPRPGEFHFDWLDRAIAVFEAASIRVILGTPTATPPKWLCDQHPDLYPVNFEGKVQGFGIRRHYCPNNPVYRDHSVRIATALADRYGTHPSVVAWQIDNEFGEQCYCDRCRTAFQRWLEKKYGTIDALNAEWGTVFWSQTYAAWSEVVVPLAYKEVWSHLNHNPGLGLDYFRFCSDSYVDYQELQAAAVKQRSPAPVTHNLMVQFAEIDYFDLARDLDVVALDNYPLLAWRRRPSTQTAMALDHTRCLKDKNFWMMEQQSGPCGWATIGDTPQPGQIRLWTWQTVAHGAEAVIYFRWRACLFGREQYWYGVLDHDGVPRRRHREVKEVGAELTRLSDLIVGATSPAEVALVKSYDNLWSHRITPHNSKFDYNGQLIAWYDALSYHQHTVDVTGAHADFGRYRAVFLPAFDLTTDEFGRKCEEYVRQGGILVVTFRSGTRNDNNRMTDQTLPGVFRDLAGTELEEFDSIGGFGRRVGVDGAFGPGTASVWCDILAPTGAEVLARYQAGFYAGKPAVTVNRFGQGLVYYVGCDLDEPAMDRLVGRILEGIPADTPLTARVKGVEVAVRTQGTLHWYVVMNHNDRPVSLPLDGNYSDELAQTDRTGSLDLGPYGVAVLVRNL